MGSPKRAAASAALFSFLGLGIAATTAAAQPTPAATAYSITISPARYVVPPGHPHTTTAFSVTDSGSQPRRIRVSTGSFAASGAGSIVVSDHAGDASSWVTATPSTFDLNPGQTQQVQVTIDIPANAEPGERQVALLFTSATAAGGGNITVSGAIGVQLYIGSVTAVDRADSVGPLSVPWLAGGGPVQLTLTVTNDGNLHRDYIEPPLRADIAGHGSVAFPAVTVLAHSHRQVSTTWDDPPWFCVCTATVTSDDGRGHPVTASARMIVVPLSAILLVLGLVVAAVGLRLVWGRIRPLLHRLTAPPPPG